MFRHVVCFKIKEDKKDMIEQAKEKILELSAIKEVKNIEVGMDEINNERSYDFVIIVDFDSKQDYDVYDKHELHTPVKDFVSGMVSEAAAVDYSV